MQNPLLYPSGKQSLRDQKVAVLSQETEVKYQIEKTVPKNIGDMALEKMIMDNLSKIGLMITA